MPGAFSPKHAASTKRRRPASPTPPPAGTSFGVPYEEGHALLGQGRCLVALGRAPEAAAPLAAAREIFARLGAKPALAETDAWLAGGWAT